jgi:hypothetical protein
MFNPDGLGAGPTSRPKGTQEPESVAAPGAGAARGAAERGLVGAFLVGAYKVGALVRWLRAVRRPGSTSARVCLVQDRHGLLAILPTRFGPVDIALGSD